MTGIDRLIMKADQYKALASKAKMNDNLQEANEYYARSDAFREAARIMEKSMMNEDGRRE